MCILYVLYKNMNNIATMCFTLLIFSVLCFKSIDAVCERSNRMLAAEDVCWTNKVKVVDRIQYTTKSLWNLAKEKLGIGAEEEYHPQQCDYYQCIFGELKMLNGNGDPNYDKMVQWIDDNIIYNHAKVLYERLNQCSSALAKSVETNSYFSGDLANPPFEMADLQGNCEILKEFMKCLAINQSDCEIFKYP